MPEHGVTIAPDLAVVNPTNSDEPLLLIHVYAPDTDLDADSRVANNGDSLVDGRLLLTVEVIYGHAFKPVARAPLGSNTSVSVDDMRAMLRGPRR